MWEAAGAIGEIIDALAVVATLGYLQDIETHRGNRSSVDLSLGRRPLVRD